MHSKCLNIDLICFLLQNVRNQQINYLTPNKLVYNVRLSRDPLKELNRVVVMFLGLCVIMKTLKWGTYYWW